MAGRWLAGAALALGAASAAQAQGIALDPGFKKPDHNASFSALVLPDGRIWTNAYTTSASGVMRLMPDGALDLDLADVADHDVYSLAQQPDGKLLAGGGFTYFAGHATGGVARLDRDGNVDTAFKAPAVAGDPLTRVAQVAWSPGDKVLVGGALTGVGPAPAHGLARLNADGSRDTGFANELPYGSIVLALHAQPDGGALALVRNIVTSSSNGLYRLAPDGRVQWFQRIYGALKTMHVMPGASGFILVGGRDMQLGGGDVPTEVYLFWGNSTVSNTFPPVDLGSGAAVTAIHALADGQILLGGDQSNSLALLDRHGNLNTSASLPALTVGGGSSAGVRYFTPQPDGKLLVGGEAITLSEGGRSRRELARLLPLTFHAITLASTPAGTEGMVRCTPNPVAHGATATCTATPSGGMRLDAFGGDCAGVVGNACTLTNVTSPKSVTVTFLPPVPVYTVASPSAGGTVDCSPNPVPYDGSTTCLATAQAGYTFAGFSGPCSGLQCHLSRVTAPQTVTAHFAPAGSHLIVTDVQPAGAGAVTCLPNPIQPGETSVCTITANAGHAWAATIGSHLTSHCSPDASGGAVCTVTNVGANAGLMASFVTADHAITAQVSPAGSGEFFCTPTGVATGGTSFCAAVPAPGHGLVSFTGCDVEDVATLLCNLNNVTADRTVTAHFAPLGGSGHVITATPSPAAGGHVACSPNPVPNGGDAACRARPKGGYEFAGFTGDCTSATGDTCQLANVTGPKAVTATFRRVGGVAGPHAIVTAALPPQGGKVTCSPSPVDDGGSATCTAEANAGYAFDAFGGDCTSTSGNTCQLANVTAARAVEARFKPVPGPGPHVITASANPSTGGSVTCTPNPVPNGRDASCTATASSGYTFVDFSGDCSGATCSLTNVTSPKSVRANFRKATATAATVSASVTGGHGTVAPPTQTVNVGQPATFTLTPDAGYQPSASVGGNCGAGSFNGNDYTVARVSADCALEFRFQATAPGTHAITTTVNPAGSGTVSCSPSPVPNGRDARCTASANPGYAFDGFGGDCTSTSGNTCTLTNVTSPKAVTARFRLIGTPPSSGVTPVPTLGHWALMLLGLLTAALGLQRLRRS
ncbi:IPTL-CTERM sorting domain-containing protein [Allofranklinella schreckenbergeri]|uniref:IPTL-CTERM sorting domain-containing protein n=1 Tax=Allofranklinella schreckenbergeri TaxID=1076744 RepID=A0A3M6R7W8_9BURK|nr:IPTL-CTERM sorting domain-containing protein [Allofranklinella schreckenbergeri]